MGECAGMYMGVRDCARVCVDFHRDTGVCEVCAGMRGCAWVCAGVGGSAWVCAGVRGCVRVYFQNFFWRIESLHQRTLIRFLYEFFAREMS